MIDYMKKAAKCKKDRGEDPYGYEKSVADPRFWNEFHADFYESVILTKKNCHSNAMDLLGVYGAEE